MTFSNPRNHSGVLQTDKKKSPCGYQTKKKHNNRKSNIFLYCLKAISDLKDIFYIGSHLHICLSLHGISENAAQWSMLTRSWRSLYPDGYRMWWTANMERLFKMSVTRKEKKPTHTWIKTDLRNMVMYCRGCRPQLPHSVLYPWLRA